MIIVTGATGQLGRQVVQQLLEKVPAAQVAVVVRDASKAADFAARGVSVRVADYNQPATVDAALEGAEKVLLISGTEIGKRVAQHTVVVEAAKKRGVKLLAYTSIPHADTTPLKLAAEHRETEQVIRASGVPFTFLRNGWYTENYTGRLPPALAQGAIFGATKGATIGVAARADYAAAAITVLTGSGHENRAYELTGDGNFTLPAYAAEISRLTGKTVVHTEVSPEALEQALVAAGLPAPFAAIMADCDVGISQGALTDPSGDLTRLIARPVTPWRETLAAAIKALH